MGHPSRPRREVFGPTAGDGPAAPPEAEKEKSREEDKEVHERHILCRGDRGKVESWENQREW
jgi:hypothetical protein